MKLRPQGPQKQAGKGTSSLLSTDDAQGENDLAKAKANFDGVPRQATLPIMSRLPIDDGEGVDEAAADPTKPGDLDYVTLADGIHEQGVEMVERGIRYTRARLPVLDEESYHLWRALHSLHALSDDYAEGYMAARRNGKKGRSGAQEAPASAAVSAPHPISDGMDEAQCPAFSPSSSLSSQRALDLVKRMFNWDALPDLPAELACTWYGVVFRSKRRAGSEHTNLYEADRRAHEEAVHSGGLLMYWYGAPSPTSGHNLATCIWTSRQDAMRASRLPLHARAAAHSAKAYESFELSRYALRKVSSETRLRLEAWVE